MVVLQFKNRLAKPTIDILLEIKEDVDINNLIDSLKSIGYLSSNQPNNPTPHLMFMKSYTPSGFKEQVFHLHVRYSADWDELYFRDYLIAHPDVAKSYGELKLKLKEKYEFNRDGYTKTKLDFIQKITQLGKREFNNRYNTK